MKLKQKLSRRERSMLNWLRSLAPTSDESQIGIDVNQMAAKRLHKRGLIMLITRGRYPQTCLYARLTVAGGQP